MRLSTFIVTLLAFTIIFVGGFGSFLAELNTNYSPANYTESEITTFNKLDTIQSNADSIRANAETIGSTGSGITDIFGTFLTQGYAALKIAAGSFSVFADMSGSALGNIAIDDRYGVFNAGFLTIGIILIFLGILIAAVLKRRL